METVEKSNPCPICHNSSGVFDAYRYDALAMIMTWKIICVVCNVAGAECQNLDNAIRAWNTGKVEKDAGERDGYIVKWIKR